MSSFLTLSHFSKEDANYLMEDVLMPELRNTIDSMVDANLIQQKQDAKSCFCVRGKVNPVTQYIEDDLILTLMISTPKNGVVYNVDFIALVKKGKLMRVAGFHNVNQH